MNAVAYFGKTNSIGHLQQSKSFDSECNEASAFLQGERNRSGITVLPALYMGGARHRLASFFDGIGSIDQFAHACRRRTVPRFPGGGGLGPITR